MTIQYLRITPLIISGHGDSREECEENFLVSLGDLKKFLPDGHKLYWRAEPKYYEDIDFDMQKTHRVVSARILVFPYECKDVSDGPHGIGTIKEFNFLEDDVFALHL